LSLRKTPILWPSNLPVVVVLLDKRLQTEPFCVGEVMTDTEYHGFMVHTREVEFTCGISSWLLRYKAMSQAAISRQAVIELS